MKKILLILAFIIVGVSLTGCGTKQLNSSEYILLSVATTNEGAIGQSLQFSVGTQKLKNQGLTEEQVQAFIGKLKQNVQTFRDEYLLNFMLIYNSKPDPKFKIGSAVVVTKVDYLKESDTVGFDIVFTSQEGWQFYHTGQGVGGVSHDYVIAHQTSSTGEYPFSSMVGQQTVAERYVEAYKSAIDIEMEYSPDLIYDYALPTGYIKSDCDYRIVQDGFYHNVWLRNLQNYKDATITLYNVTLNNALIIILLLISVLLGVGVTLLIIKIKKRRQ